MTLEKRGLEVFGRISELDNTPRQYYGLVRQLDTLMQHELAEKLEHEMEHLSNVVTFFTTGSDARLEKGSLMSELELIAVTKSDLDLNLLRNAIASVINKAFVGRVSSIVEMKGPSSSMLNYNNDAKRLQPGRIADARLISGSHQTLIDAKEQLGREIVSMPAKSVDKIAGLARDAQRTTKEGKNRIGGEDVIHFDLDNGVVFYNPKARQLAFKIGPLRLVQNKLLVEEVRHTRRENEPNFISTLASSILHRLDQLQDDKMLNLEKESINELKGHYAFFLKMYHRSEQAYMRDGTVALQLTEKESEQIAKRLRALTEIMEKLQIKKQPS